MATYVKTIDVPGPVASTFDYLASFENVAEWDPGVEEAERLDEGPLEVGSQFRVVGSFLGRRFELVYRITAIDAPKRVVLEAEGGGLRSVDTIQFEPHDGGTRIAYHADLQLQGLARVLDPALQVAFAWIGNDSVKGLREKLGA